MHIKVTISTALLAVDNVGSPGEGHKTVALAAFQFIVPAAPLDGCLIFNIYVAPAFALVGSKS